jgi:GNAT superfamily N-acetyltransferase
VAEVKNSTTESRPWIARLWVRVRHGVLAQEILDRLARAGLVVYPYFVVFETVSQEHEESRDTGPYTLRELGADDAAAVSDITLLKTRANRAEFVAARMTRARCIGAFADGKLVGYNWIGVDGVPTPGSGRQWLFMLDAGEACLFDMYVVPAHRGQRLAAILRGKVQRMLREGGFKKFYSVTLAFNRASRRFKARLGAREVELRWYLHVRIGRLPGFDVRLWRRRPHTPSPWIKLVKSRPR